MGMKQRKKLKSLIGIETMTFHTLVKHSNHRVTGRLVFATFIVTHILHSAMISNAARALKMIKKERW